MKATVSTRSIANRRRYFIGGSDARVIMGDDEAALVRLWREKRGEVEPEDLSGNLIVQLGLVTEDLNRRWYEANTGQVITDIQKHVRHPTVRWLAATPDGRVEGTGAHRPLLFSVGIYLRFRLVRKRTPNPPPFSSINSIPATSIARCNFSRASSDTRGPNPPSKRLTVGSDRPARTASSD